MIEVLKLKGFAALPDFAPAGTTKNIQFDTNL
jgi:hypothetical protein